MSLSTYPTYKQTNLEWVESLPEHWLIKPLKRNVELLTEKKDSNEYPVGLENIEGWTGRFIESESDFQGEGVDFQANDILFGKLRPYLAKVWLADRKGEAVGDFHVLRPLSGNVPGFIQYQLLTREVIDLVNGSTYGAKMPRASWDFLGSLGMPTPSEKEQAAIATFLERETAKIDSLVAEQERLIELLQEKRQAVISHAVTKGLNFNVPMKDSGVEWLGEVPEHWAVKRIKHLSQLISKGTTPSTIGSELTDEGVRFIKAENITAKGVADHPEFFISEETNQSLSRSQLHGDEVLVVIAGATTGKSAVISTEACPANTNQAVSFIRTNNSLVSEFINFWLAQKQVQMHISIGSVQSAQPNLSMEDLGNIPIAVPLNSEIEEIVNYCHSFHRTFERLIDSSASSINLLKERRSALISAAVTGQIDVRGLVPEEEVAA